MFDYVLFFGVFYHLRHPLLGLEKVCAWTKAGGVACIESFVTDSAERAGESLLEFYETDELGGQIDNWFGPTTRCLVSMCRSAGFARADLLYNDDRRAGVVCYRKLGEPLTSATPPLLAVAMNNRHEDQYFCPAKDEYMCLHFHCERELALDDVSVEAGGFGMPPLIVVRTGPGRWQTNVRLPPGLPPGAHDVTMRAHGSRPSNAVKITILEQDLRRPIRKPLRSGSVERPAPRLLALESTLDGGKAFQSYRAERMRCIFESSHRELDVASVEARIDGKRVDLMLVAGRPDGSWEINLRLPNDLEVGPHEVRIRTFDSDLSDGLPFWLQVLK